MCDGDQALSLDDASKLLDEIEPWIALRGRLEALSIISDGKDDGVLLGVQVQRDG